METELGIRRGRGLGFDPGEFGETRRDHEARGLSMLFGEPQIQLVVTCLGHLKRAVE
jgi:hypothetical protein